MKKKKLDIFNLFYSGAAVVILIGVIAKLLEWPAQDLLITGGLAIEALVFGVSAIKFVDVEEKQVGATEATLAKVADGLGNIASSGVGAADTYINIQAGNGTGAENAQLATSSNTHQGTYSNETATINGAVQAPTTSKLAIDIANNTNTTSAPATSNNAAHTLWQLEQMDILSLAKDLFFQPEWDKLSAEQYSQISILFKRIFDKKLPNKEALPFLIQFPVKLPIPEMSKLTLEKTQSLTIAEIELLCSAFSIINFNAFFDLFILESNGENFDIRARKANETQIFGGEDELVLNHTKQFYAKELIISPNVECLNTFIKVKGQGLLEHLIQKVDVKAEAEFISLTNILQTQSDELKKKLFNKFKKIRYNVSNETGYSYLKTLVQSAISFADAAAGQALFNKIIEVQIDNNVIITLDDVVNCYADTIYFGPKNEYSVNLSELFVNGELHNLNFINSIIEKLATDGIANKSKLLEVFNLKEQDSKKDVFNKLNYHLNKTNTAPSGAQLAFILLYKQYS
jgi:hypothetical protein